MRPARQLAVIIGFLFAGCGPGALELPEGVTCNRHHTLDTLSSAAAGDCVALPSGTSRQALTVPAGVHLAASAGSTTELQAMGAMPVVTLGPGASLSGVVISQAAGIGVLIERHATLSNVTVSQAGTGVIAWCEDDCQTDPISSLTDVEVTNSGVGLWVKGTRAIVNQGHFSQSQGTTLGSGYGVVASHGAQLTLNGTNVESNQELGVLVDGAGGTRATLSTAKVKNNLGRGIWAQGLGGTMAAPRLTLDGCDIEGNAIAGLGARASTGIRVTGGRIATTRLAPAQTMTPGVTVMVGDGVGMFDSTGDVELSAVTLESNQRAQLLVDTGAAGVSLIQSTVTQGTGSAGVVVQRTTETVNAPNIVTPMAGMELPISSPLLRVPVR
ncbi:MAG: right-handed parallel beta-helix repeat-containing protein [Myxococcaceae bacterium]|nr:right-handed parallel beta-helix repeat-containing protein [Myxococcaceae bacterium]